MFSKSRIHDKGPKAEPARAPESAPAAPARAPMEFGSGAGFSAGNAPAAMSKGKSAASVLAADLTVTGNLRTTGDVVIEGVVDGDIRAHLLTVGETATIRGEIVADDIVINGRVIGRVRGLKVRLTATARVEGDIIHKTIAIESGAHFEGSVQRQDDPLGGSAPAASGQPAGKPMPGKAPQGMPGGADQQAAQQRPSAPQQGDPRAAAAPGKAPAPAKQAE
ncbi:MAG: polymer-forming cytoskeletal protein [Pararhodobacter sp.]|nr:polymer-forming cytoskeletal protein [Pararhodobacter sp.]